MKSFTGVRGGSPSSKSKPLSARICTAQQRTRKNQGQLYAPKKLLDQIFHRKLSNLSNKIPTSANLPVRNSNKAFSITKRPPIPSKVSKCKRVLQEVLFSKYSDKVKLIYNAELLTGPPLGKFVIISADFIINQDSFWKQDPINTAIVKQWKILHSKFIVLWTIRKQSSLQKIQSFCQLYQLPLNAVYLIKRRGNYTVNYTPILKDIHYWSRQATETRNANQSLKLEQVNGSNQPENPIAVGVIQSVKVNTRDICDFETYQGRIPIAFNMEFSVALVRVQSSGLGLQKIISISSTLLNPQKQVSLKLVDMPKKDKIDYKMTSIPSFLADYFDKKRSECFKVMESNSMSQNNKNSINIVNSSQGTKTTKIQEPVKKSNNNISTALNSQQEEQLEEQAQKRIEQFKRDLINSIIDSNGRGFKVQGMSLQYYIGDMVKRNYSNLVAKQLVMKMSQKKLSIKLDKNLNSKKQQEQRENCLEQKNSQRNMVNVFDKIEYYQFCL